MITMPLEDRIHLALRHNPHIGSKNLRFEAEEGRVTLRGVVRSYYQKQMAQEALRYVDGVREIANDLEVAWM